MSLIVPFVAKSEEFQKFAFLQKKLFLFHTSQNTHHVMHILMLHVLLVCLSIKYV